MWFLIDALLNYAAYLSLTVNRDNAPFNQPLYSVVDLYKVCVGDALNTLFIYRETATQLVSGFCYIRVRLPVSKPMVCIEYNMLREGWLKSDGLSGLMERK